MPYIRPIAHFVLAWLVLIIIGISIHTQYIVAALENMGANVNFILRLQMTGADLINMQFPPLYGVILGLGLLLALLTAQATIRWGAPIFTEKAEITYIVAGFVGIAIALIAMKAQFDITPLAATRSWHGFLLQCITGALAGYTYYISKIKLWR